MGRVAAVKNIELDVDMRLRVRVKVERRGRMVQLHRLVWYEQPTLHRVKEGMVQEDWDALMVAVGAKEAANPGLSDKELRVLYVIESWLLDRGDVPLLRDLSSETGIPMSTVHNIVQRLEAKGFIARVAGRRGSRSNMRLLKARVSSAPKDDGVPLTKRQASLLNTIEWLGAASHVSRQSISEQFGVPSFAALEADMQALIDGGYVRATEDVTRAFVVLRPSAAHVIP